MSEVQRVEWSFRQLVENSDDIFIVVDKEYKIRYISSSVSKLYGMQPIALLGRRIFDYVLPEREAEMKRCMHEAITGQSYEVALELRKGIKTYFDIYLSYAYPNDASHGFVLKLHDITKRKVKEQELINANKQLDQVIYKTTHDLKGPLLSALGLVNLAEHAAPEQQEEYLALIKHSLLKLNSFIEEMNNFFRNEKLALQREKIQISELIKEEIKNLKNLYQADTIRIEVNASEQGDFFSDIVRIKTIATNILTNAIKYSDAKKSNSFIVVDIKVNSEVGEIVFRDNGVGIEEEHIKRIFDLFYRATSLAHGTGIGLFIVKDTIERLGGSIEVTSEPEKGTTFTIQIPNQLYQHADLN